MNMAGYNPFMFGAGGAPGMPNWMMSGMAGGVPGMGAMAGIGAGSASSFHAPGLKNEIKLFVGGLPF
jgi:hypothetical protein